VVALSQQLLVFASRRRKFVFFNQKENAMEFGEDSDRVKRKEWREFESPEIQCACKNL
jgi:hypothetical protein